MTEEIKNSVAAASDSLEKEDWEQIIDALLNFAAKIVLLIKECKDI